MPSNKRFIHLKYFKGGHRYFRDLETGQIAIADESGYFPTETDDGVLYVDFLRPAGTYGKADESIGYNVPCIEEKLWLQGYDDLGTFVQGEHCFGVQKKEFEWLMNQGMVLKPDIEPEDPTPRLHCPKCHFTEFLGHQELRVDVILDEDGDFLRNHGDSLEAAVYDSGTPYGPFTCMKCGEEVEENV